MAEWVHDGPLSVLESSHYKITVITGVGLSAPADIVVEVDGSERYATLFTLAAIREVMELYQKNGDSLGGRYMWSSGLIIVDELTFETVQDVVEDLIRSGGWNLASTAE